MRWNTRNKSLEDVLLWGENEHGWNSFCAGSHHTTVILMLSHVLFHTSLTFRGYSAVFLPLGFSITLRAVNSTCLEDW